MYLRIKFTIFITLLISLNSYSNIIYDKKNIVITELDLEYYKQLHYQKFESEINNSNALKTLVIVKKLIENLKMNNPDFINKIDENIFKEVKKEDINSEIILDIVRYFNIRNEFVYDYYYNYFEIEDLEDVFYKFNKLELPISQNKCLTIIKLMNFKGNENFTNLYFKNLLTQENYYEIFIDNKKYDVCVGTKSKKMIEKEIFKFIELKIENDFERFVYEKQNK